MVDDDMFFFCVREILVLFCDDFFEQCFGDFDVDVLRVFVEWMKECVLVVIEVCVILDVVFGELEVIWVDLSCCVE